MTRLRDERHVWPTKRRKERDRRRAKAIGGPGAPRRRQFGVVAVQLNIAEDVLAHRARHGYLVSPPPYPPPLQPHYLDLNGRPVRSPR